MTRGAVTAPLAQPERPQAARPPRLAVVQAPCARRDQEPRPETLERFLRDLRRVCADPRVSVVIVTAGGRA